MSTKELAEQAATYALAIMERDKRIAELEEALREAIYSAEYRAAVLEHARAALAKTDKGAA